MEKDSSASRLSMLDGLRGIAILLVFFNHIDFGPILRSLPSVLMPLGETLVSSGRTGVSLFFLLSGFLMGYLYPIVTSNTAFLQKRYTRIFPLFLSFVITRTVLRNFANISPVLSIAAIFIPAIVIHIIWVYFIQKSNSTKLSRILFWGFVILQIAIGGVYLFWVMRHPPIYFNQIVPPWIRESIISLTNLTLTLSFGNYIPMLDGVYWSLIGEILFYILYPIIFIPVVTGFRGKSGIIQALFLLSIIPLILGAAQLSHRLMGLFILDLPFFFFFVIGIVIANLYRKKPRFFILVEDFLNHIVLKHIPVVLFVLLFVLLNYLFVRYESNTPLIRIFSAFPFAILFIIALAQKTTFSKLLQSNILVYLGTISYSMYLVQTSIVDTAKKLYHPKGSFETILFIMIVLIVICIISFCTYYLLEKPYFNRIRQRLSVKPSYQKKMVIQPAVILIGLVVFYIVSVFFAYQSNFNFFSKQYVHSKNITLTPSISKGQKVISMKDYPKVELSFVADDDNLGILTMNLTYNRKSIFSKSGPQTLEFFIKEVGSTSWYATSSYKAVEIGNSKYHPFGFPTIPNSKGKKYYVVIKLSDASLAEYFDINIANGPIQSIYQLNKYAIIKNPSRLSLLIINRMKTVLGDHEAQRSFLFLAPFLLLSLGLIPQLNFKNGVVG